LKKSSTAIDFRFLNFHFEYLKRLQRSEPLQTKMPVNAMFAHAEVLLIICVTVFGMDEKATTLAGLEPAIPRSEVWCLIH
jgi:hypothetical protein